MHLVWLVRKPEYPAALRSGCNQITLIPGVLYSHFTRRTNRIVGFSLHQSIGDLLLRRKAAYGGRAKIKLYIEARFPQEQTTVSYDHRERARHSRLLKWCSRSHVPAVRTRQ